MAKESITGLLFKLVEIFIPCTVILLISYSNHFTYGLELIRLIIYVCGAIAIISLILAVILMKRENIRFKEAKINWDDVKVYAGKSRRR